MSETAYRITVADFSGGGRTTTTAPVWQYSTGQVLQLEGLELPASFRVDFGNEKTRDYTKPQLATSASIGIPDEYFLSGKPVYAFVVLSDGEGDSGTEYVAEVPVLQRSKPTNYTPNDVQQSVIDQLIEALNEGVEDAEQSAEDAEAWAVGERDGEPVTSEDPAYHNSSKYHAEQADDAADQAAQSKEDAAADALKAEGYAVGTQGGAAVEEGSPYYHNNADYFADQAAAKATEAAESALAAAQNVEDAEAWAVGERDGEPVTSEDPAYHNSSKYHAEQADDAADQAAQSKEDAAADALKAEGYAVGTQGGAAVEEGSPYYHNNADYFADQAAAKATEAAESASAAAASSQAVQNLGVDSETLASGSPATVEKTVDPQTGAVTLNFGIPKGDKGDKGDAATTVTNIMDMDTGKKYTVAQTVVNGFLVETFTEVEE